MVGGRVPRRVLLVSADMGDGHNAAARVLAEVIEGRWPGCVTKRVDTIELRGRWAGRLCRSAFRFQISRVPWTYQFFYDSLRRHPWFTRVSKRLVGWWFGPPLARQVHRFAPDLVISTYPLGSTALHWLRRTRGLAVTTATFITDFAIHPFWIYPGVDLHLALHEASVKAVRGAGVGGAVVATAPPVAPQFGSVDRQMARRELDIAEDRFVVLLTGGAWGVGSMGAAARALASRNGQSMTIVVCGHNEGLRGRLGAMEGGEGRLRALGYVDNMPELMAAADLVVTNGGGVTNLEALASRRPLVIFDPIAGHGKAGAALMEQVGLAVVCRGSKDLVRTVEWFASDELATRRMEQAERAYLDGKDLGRDLEDMAALGAGGGPRWRRPARVALRMAVAAALALFVVVQASFAVGTRFAHAARGAPAGTRQVAIAVAGSLPPDVLQAVSAEAQAEGIPVTFFVQGSDAAAAPTVVAALSSQGFEVEMGMWRSCRDNLWEPGDTRAEFTRSMQTVAFAVGRRPKYVAEPCGRFSLTAVAITKGLHLRRVVFVRRIKVTEGGISSIGTIPPGGIVEIWAVPGAPPQTLAQALRSLWMAAVRQGLHPVTVAQIDGAGAVRATGV
jgi:UDP-N-acetylglucosamine:LPS N-acetylglucosamine transferase/peptidoglycan/xylan/chitin deacetylase (PgdA/CDA1 family)